MPSQPTIALLPLDDRPCNHQFPRLLAPIGGLRVVTPPKRILGRFSRPGAPEACAAWLLEAAREADAVIVGLEMLAWGGMVAARWPAPPFGTALARLNTLRRLKRLRPGLPILAVSLIRRLGTTVTSARSARLHADLVAVSELSDRVQRLGQARRAEELEAVRKRLPRQALDQYLAARRRCHRVNRAAVALAADGAIDHLILAQEDALPAGPHIAEQRALRAQARALGAGRRVSIHPGADEAGLTLLARAACGLYGWRPRAAAVYSRPTGADTVALFEDRPLRRTVQGQIAAAGGLWDSNARRADFVLFVHTPRRRQTYPGAEAPVPPPGWFVRRVAEAAGAGRAAMADVAYCNGGDPELVAALGETGALPQLLTYAGWNTAGNTLGTAVAHAALRQIGLHTASTDAERRRRDLAHQTFLLHRLLDDCAYQSQIRPEARALAERLGASPYRLGRHGRRVTEFVRRQLTARCHRDFDRHFRGRRLADGGRLREVSRVSVHLPWGRLFEVALDLRLAV